MVEAHGAVPGAIRVTAVAIVGGGFAGLAMAARLRRDGVEDFVVFERGDDVGGTWRDNTYPGAACDVPSHLYSFSFLPNPNWRHTYSRQADIQAYLRGSVDEIGLRSRVRLGHELLEASWDDARAQWVLSTSQGTWRATFLVLATGALSDPHIPTIPGMERFAGHTFHSARWDHAAPLAGRDVAVIGTGASAVQLVPEIQPIVKHMQVYQRTPPWVIPRQDRAISDGARRLYARLPALQRVVREAIYWGRESYVLGFAHQPRLLGAVARVARRHMEHQVRDPATRRALTPDYSVGCKRILISSDWYPALTRPNAELITDPIREVREHSVVTDDGRERHVDTMILATGFRATEPPIAGRVHGRDGRSLGEVWQPTGMAAYKGTAVAGFPNMFFVVGPNTGLGHTSMVIMIEAQAAYIGEAMSQIARRGTRTVEVRQAAHDRYNDMLQRRLARTVWSTGGCASWYLDDHRRNTTLWPASSWSFRRQMRRFDAEAYHLDAFA